MTHPKFILTSGGHLRLGMVSLHRDLLLPGEQCFGGGWYEINADGSRLLLYRVSYDYGPPLWHLFDDIIVDSAYQGMDIVYNADTDDEYPVSALHHIIYD